MTGVQTCALPISQAAGETDVTATVAGTTHTPAAFSAAGVWTWQVRAVNAFVDGEWSAARTLTITAPLAAAPTLLLPADEAASCDATPTFTWEAVAGAESYDLEIADEGTFAAPLVSETVTELSYTPLVDLAAGGWHWRVRAANACGDGPWTTSRAFTVLAGLDAPILAAPADDLAFCAFAQPTFEWAAVDQATSYLLRVVSPTQLYTAEVTATTHTFDTAFVEPGNYAWSVTATGGSCPGASSEIRTFAVGDVPGATTLLADRKSVV